MSLALDRVLARNYSACSRAAALLACIALIGCRESDPLEAIRQRQLTGDYAGSIELLRDLLLERPDDPEANYLYGRALAATQQSSLATWALRNAMADPAWTVPAGLQLAAAAFSTADYNEAVEAAGRVLEREPDNTQALLLRANAHAHWRSNSEQALADADRLLELKPDATEAFEPRILALLSLGRTDEAGAALAELGRRLEETEPAEGARAWHCATTAIFTEESGELERARELWSRCREAHPSAPEVVWKAVRFYDDQDEPAQSIEVLRAALDDDPTSQPYRSLLADRLRLAGKIAEGEALLREATQTDDRLVGAGAWLELGRFRRKAGEPVAAVEAIERGLELTGELGPVPPQLRFEHADSLVLAKQFDRALAVADQLSVPAHRHIIRARVFQGQRRPAQALKEFDAAFLLWPDNPWARYYAARAAEDVGDFDRALEEYRTSIRIDPGATDARTRAARLLLAESKPRYAAQLLRELHHKPLDLAGDLLALRMTARSGSRAEIDRAFANFVRQHPGSAAGAAAEIAEGAAEGKSGPAEALALLRGARGIAFDDPRNAAPLRALVRFAHAVDARATTPRELRSALAAHPDSAAFQEIRGLDLELAGQAEAARAAYEHTLELDPTHAGALGGLGRLALPGDPAQALARFDAAAAADPSDPSAKLGAARALTAAGKPDEAAERLDRLLEQHPLEAGAAMLRASLDLDRGVATGRTLERATRAVRLGGGIAALELLERVHEQRGEADQAKQIAQRLRELERKGAPEGSPEEFR